MFELFKDLKKLMTDLSEEVNTMKINLERVQEVPPTLIHRLHISKSRARKLGV